MSGRAARAARVGWRHDDINDLLNTVSARQERRWWKLYTHHSYSASVAYSLGYRRYTKAVHRDRRKNNQLPRRG